MHIREKSSTRDELRALLVIALPLAAAYLAEIAMMLTDLAIVGRLGSLQLAAVGLTGDLMIEIWIFCVAVLSMVGVLVAEAAGAGNNSLAALQVRLGLVLGLAISVPGMVLTWNLPALLGLTGQDPRVLEFGAVYLHAAVWSFLPSIWFVVLREFVAALSRPRSVMVITTGAVGLNAVLSYGLVFGTFGLPELGVSGAGWATTIVTWTMFACLAWHVAGSAAFRGYPVFGDWGSFSWAGCRQILILGAPLGGIALLEGGLFAAVAILMGTISADALAANQIVISIVSMTFVVGLAIGEAAAIRVAFGMGSGDPWQARRAGFVAIGLGVVFMTAAGIAFLSIPTVLSTIFIDIDDPGNRDVVELAVSLFFIAGIYQVFDGMLVISSRALRGMRDTYVPMWIAALGYWGLGIPGGYILGFILGYGAAGLWWGMVLGLTATAMMLTRRFVRLSRQACEKAEQAGVVQD